MLNDLQRLRMLYRFLEAAETISDKDPRKQAWITKDEVVFDDFTKTVHCFFENGNFILENYKDFWVTDDALKALIEYREKFKQFCGIDNNNGDFFKEFISTAESDEIIAMAKKILLGFEYKNGLTGEARRHILSEHLRNIHHISDKKYQYRVWILAQGPECQSYDDAVNDFFDNGDPMLDKYQDYWITDMQYQVLKKFRDKFEEVSAHNHWPPEFIDTPEWTEITEMAKEVLKAFDYQKEENSTETPPNASGNENSPRV